MTATEQLQQLRRWCEAGHLRPLDVALAGFLHEQDPQAPPSLLLAAALLAQLEGQGHSCLPLQGLQQQVQGWLPGPAESTALWTVERTAALATLPPDGSPAALAAAGWTACAAVQIEPADTVGNSPLVVSAGRLYLRRYWLQETAVAAQVLARAAWVDAADGPPPVAPVAARTLIDRLFPRTDGAPSTPSSNPNDPDWQKLACALVLRGRLTLVTGGPGTGKTYTAARMLVLLQALHTGPQPLRVALAAPTGKAASRLRQSIDTALQDLQPLLADALPPDRALAHWVPLLGPARTLHALLGARPGTLRSRHDASHPLPLDVLFVDEASMVNLALMASLLQALPPQCRLVLLGDRDQLASVEAGAVMGDLCLAGRPGPVGGSGSAGSSAPTPDHGYNAQTAQWLRDLTGEPVQAALSSSDPSDSSSPPAGQALAQQLVTLRRSRRFAGAIGQLALAVNRGDTATASAWLNDAAQPEVAWLLTPDAQAVSELAVMGRRMPPSSQQTPLMALGYSSYLQAMAQRPAASADPAAFDTWAQTVLRRFDDFRVLCALRAGPWGAAGLNASIERELVARGLLQRRGEWYEGRPVMVTRNDAALGVFNGDVGVVLKPASGAALRAYFLDGQQLRSVAVTRLADVETAFAMTVHKSQGSEFAHVALVLPDSDAAVLTRELVYTGITRAKQALTLVANDPQRLAQASARLTQRFSGLGERLRG